jgi:pimeloyl-ACP methyl ester carboxylesterase
MIVDCDGVRLHVEARGEGPAVLLVHGFPHDHALWSAQLDALGGAARLLAPDLRGLGRSGAGLPYTMDRYADDLACVLDAAGERRAVVCGLSMGGYVALAFWRRHRARVRALVLADTRPGPDDDAARGKRRDLIALARSDGAAAVAARMLDGMVGKSTRARAPEVVAEVRAMLERQPVPGIVGALEAMMARPDSTPDLATIVVPTLVVVGDEDALTPPAEARAMHAAIAGSYLEVVAGAGHVSPRERPAAFNHVLAEFLRRLPEDGR